METCPHCGSEDYGTANEGHVMVCLTCGYDTENGTLYVCPGGKHYNDGPGPVCPACRRLVPRDVGDQDHWRTKRRWAKARGLLVTVRHIDRLVAQWVAEHLSTGR